jgi:hypothetical protein
VDPTDGDLASWPNLISRSSRLTGLPFEVFRRCHVAEVEDAPRAPPRGPPVIQDQSSAAMQIKTTCGAYFPIDRLDR